MYFIQNQYRYYIPLYEISIIEQAGGKYKYTNINRYKQFYLCYSRIRTSWRHLNNYNVQTDSGTVDKLYTADD